MIRNQNKRTSSIRVNKQQSNRFVFGAPCALGAGRTPKARNGCRRREILKGEDVRRGFCHQEFKPKSPAISKTGFFSSRFLPFGRVSMYGAPQAEFLSATTTHAQIHTTLGISPCKIDEYDAEPCCLQSSGANQLLMSSGSCRKTPP